jgi:hypothetical protein
MSNDVLNVSEGWYNDGEGNMTYHKHVEFTPEFEALMRKLIQEELAQFADVLVERIAQQQRNGK